MPKAVWLQSKFKDQTMTQPSLKSPTVEDTLAPKSPNKFHRRQHCRETKD